MNILEDLIPEPCSYYNTDRGYVDFARLYTLTQFCAFFLSRAKTNLQFRGLYSHPIDKSHWLRCAQTIVLTGFYSSKDYPDQLQRTRYYGAETDKLLTFLSISFIIPALAIAELYKCRLQVELSFRRIKRYLRIKALYGISKNVVKAQIWIAISVYVLVAIIKKRLDLNFSLFAILQILSVTAFEPVPIIHVLKNYGYESLRGDFDKQALLIDS